MWGLRAGAAVVGVIAVGIAVNQILQDGVWNWWALGAAVVVGAGSEAAGRWLDLRAAADPGPGGEFAQVRREYAGRLVDRFRRVDLEILLPLSEQDAHPPMQLGRVFLPQNVRVDPPPPSLPREVWRRLVETGAVAGELPAEVDREAVEEARRRYLERPARGVMDALGEPTSKTAVLLGDPGAGKSTLARYLMLALALENPANLAAGALPESLAGRLPLLVELRTWADRRWRGQSFLDLLDELHQGEGVGLPRALLERFLDEGGAALVVFDGLDEIFDPEVREETVRQISGFAARYPQARVLVTSRIVGYKRSLLDAAGFAHFMLQDLDRRQIEQFATRWYADSSPDDATQAKASRARLLGAVDRSAPVAELAGNPMLLTILAIIGRRRELPHDRWKVYQHAVEVLIEHWDVNRHLHDQRLILDGRRLLDAEDKLALLRRVARRMQTAPAGLAGNHLPGAELRQEFHDYLTGSFGMPQTQAVLVARAMLEQFQDRNFVLAPFGAGLYGFVHRAFLEYLAADDLHTQFNARELSEDGLMGVFADRWRDPAWTETLLLLAALLPPAFQMRAVDLLLAADPAWRGRRTLPQHLLLALRIATETRHVGALGPRRNDLNGALLSLLNQARQQTGLRIGLMDALAEQLNLNDAGWLDTDRLERWRLRHLDTWYLLGHFAAHARIARQTGDLPRLVATALDETADDRLRWAAAEALSTHWAGDDAALAAVLTCATHRTVGLRRAGLRALDDGWTDHPATLEALEWNAVHSDIPELRILAAALMSGRWTRESDTLAELLGQVTDSDATLRECAVLALAMGWPGDDRTLATLRDRAVHDVVDEIRRASIHALGSGWAGHDDILALLEDRALNDPHHSGRQTAIDLLKSGWPADASVSALIWEIAVQDSSESVRSTAISSLAVLWRNDDRALADLCERATDRDARVRLSAVSVLWRAWPGDDRVLNVLSVRATSDSALRVQEEALIGLGTGWAGSDDALFVLADRARHDRRDAVRRAAMRRLSAGWPGDPRAFRELLNLAASGEEFLRWSAVQELGWGWPGEDRAFPTLRDSALNDSGASVRRAAVAALGTGWPDDREALAVLHDRAAADHDDHVKQTASEMLERIAEETLPPRTAA
ncbi:hypothetical protein GCM10027589_23330 [Actinocorallia lasiicapitis]